MKKLTYVFFLLFSIFSCSQPSAHRNNTTDTLSPAPADTTLIQEKRASAHTSKEIRPEVVFFTDSMYADLDLDLQKISKTEFEKYKKAYKISCPLSGHFIKGSGIIVKEFCKDICETYLYDSLANKSMTVPSNYDAGVLGMLLSPSCKELLIYSSYDGPDYVNYYEDRAELFILSIGREKGLQAIKPHFKYYTKDWSMDELVWINDNTIALKLYDENRTGDGENLHFSYFKTKLNIATKENAE